MRITTKSNGVEIIFEVWEDDEVKEIVHTLVQLAKLMVILSQRTIKEEK